MIDGFFHKTPEKVLITSNNMVEPIKKQENNFMTKLSRFKLSLIKEIIKFYILRNTNPCASSSIM